MFLSDVAVETQNNKRTHAGTQARRHGGWSIIGYRSACCILTCAKLAAVKKQPTAAAIPHPCEADAADESKNRESAFEMPIKPSILSARQHK